MSVRLQHLTKEPSVRWSTDVSGMVIGEADGYFIGTVERVGTHHYARDCFDRYLGDHNDLDEAQRMLTAHLAVIA